MIKNYHINNNILYNIMTNNSIYEQDQYFFVNASNHLLNVLVNENSSHNNPYDILFNPNSIVDTITNNSINEKPKYKNVLSSKGDKCLKKIAYDKEKIKYDICPILHVEFENEEIITKLPCGHCFNSNAIERWLKKEKAECPVCRLKLDSVETENTEQQADHATEQQTEQMYSFINLINTLYRTSNLTNSNYYQSSILSEDDEINEAILMSLDF